MNRWRYQIPRILHDAVDGLRLCPRRSGLAGASILAGTFLLCSLLMLLSGLSAQARETLRAIGPWAFAITAAPGPAAGFAARRDLTRRDAETLRACLTGAVISAWRQLPVEEAPGSGAPAAWIATDEYFLGVRDAGLVSGRGLDRWDVQHADRAALVTRSLAEARGLQVGSRLDAGDLSFYIVGIVEPGGTTWNGPGSLLGAGSRAVLVPFTAVSTFRDQRDLAPRVDGLLVRARDAEAYPSVLEGARRILAHSANPGALDWMTPDRLVARTRALQTLLGLGAGLVTLICLLLGGITLSSLMISNVQERIPEIGLRRALGGQPAEIALQFILEGFLLSLAAACAGTLLALGGMTALAPRLGWPAAVDMGVLGVPVLVAGLLGIGFSWIPARRASRLAPSMALRNG